MDIRDFLHLSENEREYLISIHNKSKRIRNDAETIKREEEKLRMRRLNLQLECEHPYKRTKYEAFENEFGNFTGGGEYVHYCPDCDRRWTSQREEG
ncbi:MAG: hypothetical protein EBU90_14030 [Proteobacteria bacterium]|nr:hypothetical protein [Pseudomonadota bacterium]